MDNYYKYLKESGFLECYDTTDEKIIVNFLSGKEKISTEIPNTAHNLEVCKFRLQRQNDLFLKEGFQELLDHISTDLGYFGICNGIILTWSIFSTLEFSSESLSFFLLGDLTGIGLWALSTIPLLKDASSLYRATLNQHLFLYSSEIELLMEDPNRKFHLSKKGERAYLKDGGFCLNHNHEYSTKDLRKLEKVIKREYGY